MGPKIKPLFTYSAKPELIASGWAFALVVVATSYAILSEGVDPFNIAWISLIEFVFFYEILVRWRLPFWSVKFYEDRIFLEKRGSRVQIEYPRIQEVRLSKSIWWGKKLTIYTGRQGSPVTVLRNPKDSKLKTDLYSWLLTKKSEWPTPGSRTTP